MEDLNKSDGLALVSYSIKNRWSEKFYFQQIDLYSMYLRIKPYYESPVFNHSTGEIEYREKGVSYDKFIDEIDESQIKEYFNDYYRYIIKKR